jgi:hypothetical protein
MDEYGHLCLKLPPAYFPFPNNNLLLLFPSAKGPQRAYGQMTEQSEKQKGERIKMPLIYLGYCVLVFGARGNLRTVFLRIPYHQSSLFI